MAKKRRKKKKNGRGVLAASLIMGVICITAMLILWLYVIRRPSLVLAAPDVEIEAGEGFDEWSLVTSLSHADREQITVDKAALDTEKPGQYEVIYTLTSPIGVESLPVTVHVRDTVPPELVLKKGPIDAEPGDEIRVEDLVESCTDRSAVSCTLENGESVFRVKKGKVYELTVVAEDSEGNRSQGSITVDASIPEDEEPPVIKGVKDTAVRLGSEFDVLEGVRVLDDLDPEPALTVSAMSVDTSVPGTVELVYTAEDLTGKTSEKRRTVTVANDVITYGKRSYGVYWDLTGIEGQPYLIAVNRPCDTVTVYQQDDNGRYTIPVKAFVCSTGPATPEGVFATSDRYRWQYLFEDCWGQYATRIHDHILFHSVPYNTQNPGDLEYEEYNKLGTPASLGCIRLSVEDVKWIYDNCPTGFSCVIYDDPVTPGPMGKPDFIRIDTGDPRRGWDPTDPDPVNPWHTQGAAGPAEGGEAGAAEASSPEIVHY